MPTVYTIADITSPFDISTISGSPVPWSFNYTVDYHDVPTHHIIYKDIFFYDTSSNMSGCGSIVAHSYCPSGYGDMSGSNDIDLFTVCPSGESYYHIILEDSKYNASISGGSVLTCPFVNDGLLMVDKRDFTNGTDFLEPSGYINASFPLSGGGIIYGGNFKRIFGYSRRGVVKFKQDGFEDDIFYDNMVSGGPGLSGSSYEVNDFGQQSTGKIIIGGNFTQLSGQDRKGVFGVNSNGSQDSSFYNNITSIGDNTGLGPNDGTSHSVTSIIVQPNDQVILGGKFTKLNGSNVKYLVRVGANGIPDTSFNSNVNSIPLPGYVNDTSMHMSSNHILACGYESLYNGYLKRISSTGTLDTAFRDNFEYYGIFPPVGQIYTVKTQTDNKIIIAGSLTSVTFYGVNKIARLNSDGTLDTAFTNNIGTFDGSIYAVHVQQDGKIVVGGDFKQYNGNSRKNLIRLNANGTEDTTFYANLISTGDNSGIVSDELGVRSIIEENGELVVSGDIERVNGFPNPSPGRFDSNTGTPEVKKEKPPEKKGPGGFPNAPGGGGGEIEIKKPTGDVAKKGDPVTPGKYYIQITRSFIECDYADVHVNVVDPYGKPLNPWDIAGNINTDGGIYDTVTGNIKWEGPNTILFTGLGETVTKTISMGNGATYYSVTISFTAPSNHPTITDVSHKQLSSVDGDGCDYEITFTETQYNFRIDGKDVDFDNPSFYTDKDISEKVEVSSNTSEHTTTWKWKYTHHVDCKDVAEYTISLSPPCSFLNDATNPVTLDECECCTTP